MSHVSSRNSPQVWVRHPFWDWSRIHLSLQALHTWCGSSRVRGGTAICRYLIEIALLSFAVAELLCNQKLLKSLADCLTSNFPKIDLWSPSILTRTQKRTSLKFPLVSIHIVKNFKHFSFNWVWTYVCWMLNYFYLLILSDPSEKHFTQKKLMPYYFKNIFNCILYKNEISNELKGHSLMTSRKFHCFLTTYFHHSKPFSTIY